MVLAWCVHCTSVHELSSGQVVVLAWSMMMVFVVALAIIELLVVVELLGGQLIQVHLGAAAMLDVLT